MAQRKRGMKNIPSALSQAKDVFPITPFRRQMGVGTPGTNDEETIDLSLQFEDNEVFDIWTIEYHPFVGVADPPIHTDVTYHLALFEDPDKALATDIGSEAIWEDDDSIIHSATFSFLADESAVGNSLVAPSPFVFNFPQPYTVARNLKIIGDGVGTLGAGSTFECRIVVWGRRRNASDAEFKNIIYRQRF